MLQAYRFALDPTPAQARALASHCGAARKAFNEGLAQVKRCLDQRGAERSYGVPDGLLTEVPWSLPALRRWWNQVKDERAPWWAENSKEAYNSGLDALARGLKAWSDSRSGKRRGPKIAFPKFRGRHRARPSCRFSTGAIRVHDGRTWCCLASGGSRPMSPPPRCWARSPPGRHGFWPPPCPSTGGAGTARSPSRPGVSCAPRRMWVLDRLHPVVGVDLGVRDLLVAAAPDGTEVARIPAPKPLARVQARLRAVQRKAARQAGPDRRSGQRPSMRWTQDRGADRAGPRPGSEHPPGRAAQGHHAAGPVPPGDRGRGSRSGEHDPPQTRRRQGRARAQPGAGRRRPGRAAAPARLQDHLVRLGPICRGPVVSQLEDLFGVRRAKAKPDPGRTDLDV